MEKFTFCPKMRFLMMMVFLSLFSVQLRGENIIFLPGTAWPNEGNFEYDGIVYEYRSTNYAEQKMDGATTVKEVLINKETIDIPSIFAFNPEHFASQGRDWMNYDHVVKKIGDWAFKGCPKLEKIIFPEYLGEIGNYSFSGTALKEVDIPARVTHIGEGAFKDCVYLETVNLAFGETCGSIAFENCIKLKEISIPATITEIGEGTFRGCNSLETVHLAFAGGGETCGSIAFGETCGSVAFENCTNLKEIIIGNDGSGVPVVTSHGRSETDNYVVTFASNTFKGCGSIEKITVHSDVVVEFGEDAFDADVYEKATVYVPDGSVDEFKQSEQWGRFKDIKDLSSSSIEDVATDNINEIVQVYTLSGIEVYSGTWNERPELPKGVYIMHSKNGSSKKIAIR